MRTYILIPSEFDHKVRDGCHTTPQDFLLLFRVIQKYAPILEDISSKRFIRVKYVIILSHLSQDSRLR